MPTKQWPQVEVGNEINSKSLFVPIEANSGSVYYISAETWPYSVTALEFSGGISGHWQAVDAVLVGRNAL